MFVRKFLARIIHALKLEIHIRRPHYHYVPDYYGYSSHKQLDVRNDHLFLQYADEARRDHRTLMYYDRLYVVYQCLKNILLQKPPAEPMVCAEAGVYKGGVSFFIASMLHDFWPGKKYTFAIDTFEGHSALDIPGGREAKQVPGLFRDASFNDVKAYLARFPFCDVLKGRIQDVASRMTNHPFDFIHLDMDLYVPTKFALEFFIPRMSPGGMILLDDYLETTTPGIAKAVNESGGRLYRFHMQSPQCVLINHRPTEEP